jgi:hypothetical protein
MGKDWGGFQEAGEVAVKTNPQEVIGWGGGVGAICYQTHFGTAAVPCPHTVSYAPPIPNTHTMVGQMQAPETC